MRVERVHVSCHVVTLRQANPHLVDMSQSERGNNRLNKRNDDNSGM